MNSPEMLEYVAGRLDEREGFQVERRGSGRSEYLKPTSPRAADKLKKEFPSSPARKGSVKYKIVFVADGVEHEVRLNSRMNASDTFRIRSGGELNGNYTSDEIPDGDALLDVVVDTVRDT